MPVCWGLRRGAAGRLAHSGAEPVLGAVSPYLRLCPGAPGRGFWSPVPPEPWFLFCERTVSH